MKVKEEAGAMDERSEDGNVPSAPRREGRQRKEEQVAAPFPIRSVALWSLPSILVYPALLGSFIAVRHCSRRVRDFFYSFSSS